jgi:hypothetical protein
MAYAPQHRKPRRDRLRCPSPLSILGRTIF